MRRWRVLSPSFRSSTANLAFTARQGIAKQCSERDDRPVLKGVEEATADTTSARSFGEGKFEVTSSVVGIAILVISLGALYMFLTFVYQVEVMPL